MNAVTLKVPDFINDPIWKLYDSHDIYFSAKDSRVLDEEEIRAKEKIPLTERIKDRNYIKIGTREEYLSKDSKSWGKQIYFLEKDYLLKVWGLCGDDEGVGAILMGDDWYVLSKEETLCYKVSYNHQTLEITHLSFYVADEKTFAVKKTFVIEA